MNRFVGYLSWLGRSSVTRATAPFVYVRMHGPDPTFMYRGSYPDDDLKAQVVDGKWRFVHKDGSPY